MTIPFILNWFSTIRRKKQKEKKKRQEKPQISNWKKRRKKRQPKRHIVSYFILFLSVFPLKGYIFPCAARRVVHRHKLTGSHTSYSVISTRDFPSEAVRLREQR